MSKMTIQAGLVAAPALFLALALGCGKNVTPDSSRVIANIGGSKLTEAEFQDIVKSLSPDPKEAQAFLTDAGARNDRAQLAQRIAMSRAVTTYAAQTGLDKDPSVKRQLEQQQANIYFQALMKKRMAGLTPTDEQLQTFYKERVEALKTQGHAQGIPPFETVKAQLPELWRQQHMQTLSDQIQNEVKQKVPVTLADDYRPAGAE
ncbi:hypothetical protein [Geothrix fuzhouensis]|uniref:hypothetical protein n=1 Tax=Geothrix fuzhouensis TaxID=2966451 RepID=UPI0021491F93|nr:hypothetical protein [Geothrix fuzhouensis]